MLSWLSRGWALASCLAALLLVPSAVAQVTSFSVGASPSAVTLYPGTSQAVQVQAAGFSTSLISVSFAGLPTGVTASPSTLVLTPGGTGAITLTAALNADSASFPAASASDANTHTTAATLTAISGSYTATVAVNLTVSLTDAAFMPTQVTLPVLRINTSNVPVVSKTTDVAGTISIASADGSQTFLPSSSDTDNTATFHVHGNTTALMPKLPYEMKLGTSVDLLSLLGVQCPYVTSSGKAICDKSKSYVLLANYDDKSMLRDWAASALANAIPIGNGYLDSPADSPTPSGTSTLMPWAPHSIFVEMYLNNAYEGVYQLIEKVNVDSHRVNIPELSESDVSDDITGGYLLEIDQHQDEAFVFHTPQDLPIGLIDPDFSPDPEVPQQTSYISSYVDSAENALFGSSYTNATTGWRAYFDDASLVNFYIVNDVMGNVDGGDFYSSDYLYKTVDNPLLYMGPVWDFDISAGNVSYEPIFSPTVPWMQVEAIWYKQLFTDSSFTADVTTQWNALKKNGIFTQWLASIQTEATTLAQASTNNFTRWPILGERVWPNMVTQGSYTGEVSYLTGWLNARIAYLDAQFNNRAVSTVQIVSTSSQPRAGAALTYTVQVSGGGAVPTGKVSLLISGAVLATAQLDASGQATLQGALLYSGPFNAVAVYDGDSTYGYAQSASVPITVLPPLVPTSTTISVPGSVYVQGSNFTISAIVADQTPSTAATGTVTFASGGVPLGQASVSNGVATVAIPAGLTAQLPPAIYPVTATYSGDSTHGASTGSFSIAITGTSTVTSSGVSSPTATPVLSLASGAYGPGNSVTITDPQPGAVIYYTVDGSYPTGSSPVYSGPIPITANLTLQAIAGAQKYTPSAVVTGIYQLAGSVAAGSGFTASNLSLNGSAKVNGGVLELTDGGLNEAGSAWSSSLVSVSNFTTDFDFQIVNPQADGFTFTLQNAGPTALGSLGCGLGYGPCQSYTAAIPQSIAFKFDLYNNAGEGNDSFGIYLNGAAPTVPSIDLTPSGLNLHSGDTFHMHMSYDGTTLSATLTDRVTGKSLSASSPGDIPGLLGSVTAYAGFTGGTGGESADINILDWTYTSN